MSEYNNFIKTQEAGGSATTAAFVSAVKMGFSKIIMTGVDLALKGETVYSNGEMFEKIAADQIKINSVVKNITTVPSVTGIDVLTTDDYAAFIHHFTILIKDLGYTNVYNTTSFGALIPGMKNAKFETILLQGLSNTTSMKLGDVQPVKYATEKWTQEELALINQVIEIMSKGVFSPALISSVVKSPLLYLFMQADILKVLQSKMDDGLAEGFIAKAKEGIKCVIEILQRNKLI